LFELLFDFMELPHGLYLSIDTIVKMDGATECLTKRFRVFSHGIEYLSKNQVKLPFYCISRFLLNTLHVVKVLMELKQDIL